MVDDATEASLPAAVSVLHDSVGKLIDEQKGLVGGRVLSAPSWWDRLVEATAASSLKEGNRLVPASRPPAWSPAIDMITEITAEVRGWLPGPDPVPVKLRAIASRRWAPPEVETVSAIGARVAAMAVEVRRLLEPPPRMEVKAACPAPDCGVRTVRRKIDGEWIRTAALHLDVETGCSCLSCGSHWRPEQFTWLATLIGCTPVGS